MDLDAAHGLEAMGGSTSSPHTTPPSNSGEHSMSHSTIQRNSFHGMLFRLDILRFHRAADGLVSGFSS
jgi:hypothetical protein